MDNNKHVTELLSFYIDGICTPEEKKRVEEHLPGCAQCRQALADLRQTIKMVGELEEVEPPAGIWEGIERKIGRKPVWGIFGWKPVPAAIIAMAVLLIAVSINKYATKITSQTGTEITPLLAPMVRLDSARLANVPFKAMEKSVEKKKEAPAPALAGNAVMEKVDDYSMAPAKDSCGATAVSQMVPAPSSSGGLASPLSGGSASPYTIEMQVADREKSFRAVETMSTEHRAKKLGQKDSQEIFLQMQQEQFNRFINDLNRMGSISQPVPYLGPEPEPVEAGATTTPKMINIRFNSPR